MLDLLPRYQTDLLVQFLAGNTGLTALLDLRPNQVAGHQGFFCVNVRIHLAQEAHQNPAQFQQRRIVLVSEARIAWIGGLFRNCHFAHGFVVRNAGWK